MTKNIDVAYEKGEINFQEYIGETRKKSSNIGEREPLVYVRMPWSEEEAKIAPSFGFRLHEITSQSLVKYTGTRKHVNGYFTDSDTTKN